jgi:glycerol-3-phosphate cytidylyltransferase
MNLLLELDHCRKLIFLGEDHVGGRFTEIEQWCRNNNKQVVRLKRTPGICFSDLKK